MPKIHIQQNTMECTCTSHLKQNILTLHMVPQMCVSLPHEKHIHTHTHTTINKCHAPTCQRCKQKNMTINMSRVQSDFGVTWCMIDLTPLQARSVGNCNIKYTHVAELKDKMQSVGSAAKLQAEMHENIRESTKLQNKNNCLTQAQ